MSQNFLISRKCCLTVKMMRIELGFISVAVLLPIVLAVFWFLGSKITNLYLPKIGLLALIPHMIFQNISAATQEFAIQVFLGVFKIPLYNSTMGE